MAERSTTSAVRDVFGDRAAGLVPGARQRERRRGRLELEPVVADGELRVGDQPGDRNHLPGERELSAATRRQRCIRRRQRTLANPDSAQLINDYVAWPTKTKVPMLMFSATPGAIMPEASVAWAKTNIRNLESVPLGAGAHFVQEDYPVQIGLGISSWLGRR